ncbi:MAG: DUF948 domain-containing protein [Microlunatus sp.]|nr:DUF948 domain-containing protein [Microlunatus sp.]MDN5770749.1 DUF948 domain-containing protein [Microlunatus sp.]MDN5805345.1 DUF948 domain-containing protein [Microlunatus sp.]
MTLGGIAGLIAAVAFVALVGLAAVPLIKLGRVLDELRRAVSDVGQESVPILTELQETVRVTNDEIGKLGLVTEDVAAVSNHATVVTKNAANVSALVGETVGGPLIKVAAVSHGLRAAVRGTGPGTDLEIAASPRRQRRG